MRSNLLVKAALAVAFALPLMGGPAAPAEACENGVELVVDTVTPRVARAEKALNEGKYTLAAVGIVQVFPRIDKARVTQSPIAGRALRIMALAVTRTDGSLTAGKHWQGTTPEAKAQNLQWAIDTLRALHTLYPKKPAVETDLAEALSKVDAHKGEALEILTRLAAKDLITSAQGYAALAKLRDRAGDKSGGAEATKKCESMAKKLEVCRQSGGPSV